MSDVKEFNCMNVKLGDIDAVVCMMDVKTLIDVQYIARRGVDQEPGAVQRVLNPVRVNAIYEYVLKGNIFYTPFILNWTNDEVPLQFDNNQLRFLSCAHSAQVLDGQHRIAGLMKAIDKMPEIGTKEVLVIMAQHLDTIDAAKIFLNINTEQKPVQKSLLYDLFGIVNQDDTKIPAVRAKDIAERLNLETDSPYYGYIKFPGNKRGTKGVDLSTVVNSLSLKLGKNSLIERYNIANLENQYAVFKNYFAAIKTSYDRENLWENRANPFLTNAGFYGAIEAFELIFQKCAQRKDFTQRAFEEEMQVSSLLRQSDLSKLEGKEQRKRVLNFYKRLLLPLMSLLKMAISFEKRECQTRCEIEVRIQQGLPPDSNDFDFRNLEVTTSNVPVLSGACQADAVGFYYNALISYLEGFFQLMNKQYSWAIVKLYYAVYYCARAQMGFRKYAVIRHANDLYSIKMTVGEKAKRQRCRNDHNLIIGLYAEYFPSTYILSNKIDDVYYTEYMMNLREVTHYKQKAMKDPLWLDAFDELNKEIKSGKAVASVLNDCLSNLDSYCFDEKYAYLVTTFMMLKETAQMYKSQTCRMSTIQSKYIKQLLNKCKLIGYEAQLLS